MKRNVMLGLAVIGIAAAMTAPAKAGVSFDIHIGLPLPPIPAIVVAPPRPRVVIPPPPVCAPPVVIVRPPVPYCPPPVVVACPPPVVVRHPHFIPPGHAKRLGYHHVDYRHHGHHGRGHGHH